MTESEWLASDDVRAMLDTLLNRRGGAPLWGHELPSERKLRLFACACWRHVWPKPEHQAEAAAVEAWADGEARRPEVPSHWVNQIDVFSAAREAARQMDAGGIDDRRKGAALLREVVGNPWRPVPLGPSWRTPIVRTLATLAYRGPECGRCGGFGHTKAPRPISNPQCAACGGTGDAYAGTLDAVTLQLLADALEDAGCDSEPLLRHLRGEEWYARYGGGWPGKHTDWHPLRGPHVRGCWALDLVLGKS